jgi:sulfate adenylyltransferase
MPDAQGLATGTRAAVDAGDGVDPLSSSAASHGFTVFFTGFSGAGKSTLATVLRDRLLERNDRDVVLFDGDLVRRQLSAELGFSKAHRDLNVERIGFVASQVTRAGGAALCAAIAPYDDARRRVRAAIESVGGYVLVHVATPIEVCERRDPKGLYAKARAGTIPNFTGISDPYEIPTDADLSLDTSGVSVDAAVQQLLAILTARGYLERCL